MENWIFKDEGIKSRDILKLSYKYIKIWKNKVYIKYDM